jgi:hypothetical protein
MAHGLLCGSHMDTATETNVLPRSDVDGTAESCANTDSTPEVAADVLERSAAYVAARSVLQQIHQLTVNWPTGIGKPARERADAMAAAIAQSLQYPPTSAARRRCLRNAIGNAIELSALCDVARAQGLSLDDSMRSAGRTMSLLGLAFHATHVSDDG